MADTCPDCHGSGFTDLVVRYVWSMNGPVCPKCSGSGWLNRKIDKEPPPTEEAQNDG